VAFGFETGPCNKTISAKRTKVSYEKYRQYSASRLQKDNFEYLPFICMLKSPYKYRHLFREDSFASFAVFSGIWVMLSRSLLK
jgi:hypothetical protein